MRRDNNSEEAAMSDKRAGENGLRATRREFLKGMAAAGGAAALGTWSAGTAADTEQVSATRESPSESKGYRVTQHIRDYYRVARS